VADWANVGRRACGKKKKKRPAGLIACGPKVKGERERVRVLPFFLNFLSNSFFKHSNFNQTKSMHSKHDAQKLIISKLF
jgi:hypothetical protein